MGGELLYTSLSVSAKHQHESATGVLCPLVLSLSPVSLHIPPLWIITEPLFGFPKSQQIPTGYLFYKW